MATPAIPDKLYFRIGEVSRIAGVKPFVLRFWETEFPMIAPKATEGGHRLYRRKDVEMVLHIKELLHQRRYTIEGARRLLQEGIQPAPAGPQDGSRASLLDQGRQELREILVLLDRR